MYCAKCGTPISEGKYFCSNCGHLNTPAIPQRVDPAGETTATPVYVPVEPSVPEPTPAAVPAEAPQPAPVTPATSAYTPPPATSPVPPAPVPSITPPQVKVQGFWVPIVLYFVIGLIVSLALNKNDAMLLAKFNISFALLAKIKLVNSLSFLALVAFGPPLAFVFSKIKKPVIFLIIGTVIAVAGLIGMGISANINLFNYSSLAILASVPFLLSYTGANHWSNHALRLVSALVGVIASVILLRVLGQLVAANFIYPVFAGLALLLLLLLIVTAKYSADKVFGKISIKDVGMTGLHLIMIYYAADLLNSLLSYFSILS